MTKHPLENYSKTGCLGFQVGIWRRFEPIFDGFSLYFFHSWVGNYSPPNKYLIYVYMYNIYKYIIYIGLGESFDSLP